MLTVKWIDTDGNVWHSNMTKEEYLELILEPITVVYAKEVN